jgi:outer membrane beta-barrel protein
MNWALMALSIGFLMPGLSAGAAVPAAAPAVAASLPGSQPADRIYAMPGRGLPHRHRVLLSPSASLSVNDPFFLRAAVGAAAHVYVSEHLALGLGADWLYANASTPNLEGVRQIYFSVPSRLEQPVLLGRAEALWSLFYGKVAVGQGALCSIDLYLTAGAGVAHASAGPYALAGFFGIGQHYSLGDWLALRFELRDAVFRAHPLDAPKGPGRLQNYLMLSAGVGFLLPSVGAR